MVDPSLIAGGDHSVFVCGNDHEAKAQVTDILGSFGRRDVIDLGGHHLGAWRRGGAPLMMRLG